MTQRITQHIDRHPRRRPSIAFAALALLAGLATDAHAVVQGACVDEVSGVSNNCTANDLTFLAVGLGVQDDGCVSSDDTVSIFLRSVIRNTTAQTRYDVGMYFATDGDPNGDGARTGACAREVLRPVHTVAGVSSCPPLDLASGVGPYFNADGDLCGDLITQGNTAGCDLNGDGLRDPAILDLDQAVAFPCLDLPLPNPTGFVNIPTCATWGNQQNEVDTTGDGRCDSAAEAIPGTKAKCRCESVDTTIPAPKLALSCSCSPDPVRPGTSTVCGVSYTNTISGCSPDPSTPERERCGTASYVRFEVDYDQSKGSVSGLSETTGGTAADNGDRIVWTPRSANGTLGIISPTQTPQPHTLTYTYTVAAGAPDGAIPNNTLTIWSNSPSFSSPKVQPLTVSCALNVSATYASVHSLRASVEAGEVTVAWETASETGTLGFELERLDPATGAWVRLDEQLLPAVQETPGGSYRLADPGAPTDRPLTYRVIEVETSGIERPYGPFTVTPEPQERRTPRLKAAVVEGGFEARSHAPSASLAARLAKAAQAKPAASSSTTTFERVKVVVRESGLYRVDAATIAAAFGHGNANKVAGSIKGGNLRLSHRGAEVAWQGVDQGAAILFYGEAIDSPFTRDNVYWIDPGHGRQMGVELATAPLPTGGGQSFLTTVHREQDLLPRAFLATDPSDDYWFWDGVLSGHATYGRRTLSFTLEGVAATTATHPLTIGVWGLTDSPAAPDHRASIAINGTAVGDILWDGPGPHSEAVSVPQGVLKEGANTLTVTGLTGNFLLDAVDVTYDRLYRAAGDRLLLTGDGHPAVTVDGFSRSPVAVYDVTDPQLPVRLAGTAVGPSPAGGYRVTFSPAAPDATYLAVAEAAAAPPGAVRGRTPVGLTGDSLSADYLVITTAELATAARRLADHRAGQGLVPLVVTVEDVYDELADGIADPEALRDLLVQAHRNWALPPRRVLLAGKGSFDYRNLLGLGGNLVPPLMAATPSGLVPADNLFGDVEGDDGVPEIAVGRLPVVSAAELDRAVDKILAYEAAGAGAWRHRVLLAADNPDPAGDFPAASDRLATRVPASYTLDRVYLGALPAAEARQRTLDGVRQGALLVSYLGHGGLDRFAEEGLLRSTDVASLDNGERLPFVSALTCNIGLFAFPGFTSLGEELVLDGDGGAVAVWAPVGLSFNDRAAALGERLFRVLFEQRQRVLGDALVAALRQYVAAGGDPGMAVGYGLLGDPALTLAD